MNLTLAIVIGLVALWVVVSLVRGYREKAVLDPVGIQEGPGEYEVEVVGESHYQAALEHACGGRKRESANNVIQAVLILDDRNLHDPNAVRVEVGGRIVGHLPRHLARRYRQRLREAGHPRLIGKCNAVIRGGWDRGPTDRGYFGIWLDLPTTEGDVS